MPESKDQANYDQIKWRRYNYATHDTPKARKEFYKPKNLVKSMRLEIIVLSFGIFMGLSKC